MSWPDVDSAEAKLQAAAAHRSRGQFGLAVVHVYDLLWTEGGRTGARFIPHVHLFLSETFAEMSYRGFERLHARIGLRAARELPQADVSDLVAFFTRLARALRGSGDLARAEKLLREAETDLENRAAPDGAALAEVRLELAQAAIERGDLDGFKFARDRLDKTIGGIASGTPTSRFLPDVLALQARLLIESWRLLPDDAPILTRTALTKAEELLRQAIGMLDETPSRRRSAALRDLATVLRLGGRTVEAIDTLQMDLDDGALIQRVDTETVVGMVLCAGRLESASILEQVCPMILERNLHAFREFSTLGTEGDSIAFAGRLREHSDLCLSLLAARKDRLRIGKQILDLVIARKAVVSDSERAFWRSWRAVDDPDIIAAGKALVIARNSLGACLAAGQIDGVAQAVEEIETRQQILSIEPSWRSFQASDSKDRAQVERFLEKLRETGSTWAAAKAAVRTDLTIPKSGDVAARLPSDAALIEFVRIRHFDSVRERLATSGVYWALVLRHNATVEPVEIGEADEIDREIASVLAVLRTVDPLDADVQVSALKRLAERLWAPLATVVAGMKSLLISPEGMLGLCPFAALPTGGGRFLVEDYVLQQVASGRDLLPAPDEEHGRSYQPIIFADPEFGNPQSATERGLGICLERLKESGREAKVVREALGGKAEIIVHKQVTKAAFQALSSPRVLHVATHGLVLPNRPPDPGVVSSADDVLAANTPLARHLRGLSLTGLALAGFHEVTPGTAEDGLLTALEASALDLRFTALVVLSACDTGVGDPIPNEGLLGLVRSLRAAGSRAVVMSLWQLRDVEAVNQMRIFYRHFVANGSPATALACVQRTRITRLREVLRKAPPAIWAPLAVMSAI